MMDCARTLTKQRHAVKDYYPSRPSITPVARGRIEVGAMMPGNAATSFLLHHDGRADRYPLIEICDVLVPHPETAG
jgi:hypothetical protein